MKKFIKLAFLIGTVMFLFTGCRTATLQNVQSQKFTIDKQSEANLEHVATQIIEAGKALGWQMKKSENENVIYGALFIRGLTAKIKIPYTTTEYSILYFSSNKLKYDATKNTIHQKYNGWIQNLDNSIKGRLNPF